MKSISKNGRGWKTHAPAEMLRSVDMSTSSLLLQMLPELHIIRVAFSDPGMCAMCVCVM